MRTAGLVNGGHIPGTDDGGHYTRVRVKKYSAAFEEMILTSGLRSTCNDVVTVGVSTYPDEPGGIMNHASKQNK